MAVQAGQAYTPISVSFYAEGIGSYTEVWTYSSGKDVHGRLRQPPPAPHLNQGRRPGRWKERPWLCPRC